VWDTSGARQFLSITTTHYRFAVGAFLVYDVTNIQSFINLRDWLHKIREFSDANVIIALVANKADLVEDDDKMKNYGRFASRDGSSSVNSNNNYSNLVQDTEEDNENSHDRRSRRDQQRNNGNFQSNNGLKVQASQSPRRHDQQHYQTARFSPSRPTRTNH
jgi:GTPase SAR1 family protein